MLKAILVAVAALLASPLLGQTSATVEIIGHIFDLEMTPMEDLVGYEEVKPIGQITGSGHCGHGGGGAITPPPPPPPGPRVCYGVHDWKIDLNPGMGPITGSYSGRTTAVWKYDESARTVSEANLLWSGSSHGVGVTCEGAISGAGASWTGAWNAKQSTGIVWKEKRMSAIYKLAASLSTFESSVQ